MMFTRCTAAVALWALAAHQGVQAGDSIATDRPDVVESSEVVGPGRFQIETSLAMEREAEGEPRTRVLSTPTLLRYGVSDVLELRLETDGWARTRVSDAGGTQTDRGFSDVAVGVKWHVRTPADSETGPSMAWLFHADLPTGSDGLRGRGVRPSARLVAEWDFGTWSLGVMPGVFVDSDEQDDRYLGGILAAVVGMPITERWRGFAELAADRLTSQRHGGNVVSANLGTAYLLSDTVQVDLAVSRGLTDAAPRQQWTVGLSVLY